MGYSNREHAKGWTETAIKYAERFGWHVVPLTPNPQIAQEDADDRVIQQLGRSPLIDVPDDASDQPKQIQRWTGYPVAALAVLTGARSNLAAIEIGPEAEDHLDEREFRRFRTSLPDTRCVRGPDREYVLFSLTGIDPEQVELPRFSRSSGMILHGEESLIRVPTERARAGVRAFRWDIQSSDRCAALPEEVLSFFGIDVESNRGAGRGPSREDLGPTGSNGRAVSAAAQTKVPSSFAADDTSSHMEPSSSSSRTGSLSFRSGDELMGASEATASPHFSWLRNGSLTVLSGPTKTAGKSTFVVNLAAHLASGRPFLGTDVEPTRVVLLSDLPAAQFRQVLGQIGIGAEARERLHVIHPRDVRERSWQHVLSQTFSFADEKEAGVVIIDSLDQFVELKSGIDPTTNVDVAHTLTSDAPSHCAVLGVKALSPTAPRRMEDTLDRLGLLGKAADVVMQMTEGPPSARRTLRCLEFASRLDAVPSHFYCGKVHGLYQKVPGEPARVDGYRGDGSPAKIRERDGIQTHLLNQGGQSASKSTSDAEPELLRDPTPRPSIVHQKLMEAPSTK